MGQLCPCHSGKRYAECCQRYHLGVAAENALLLMRSRYAAYALGLADYIIETTHPNSSLYQADKNALKEQILQFSKQTSFDDLEILDFQENENEATVTFHARLTQNKRDASFREKSFFDRIDHRWLYSRGEVSK